MFNDMFIVSAFKFDHDELEYFIPEISISKLFPENDCDDIVKTVGFELIGEIVIIKSYGSATVTPDGRISDNGIEIVVDPVVNIFSKIEEYRIGFSLKTWSHWFPTIFGL